MHGDAPWAHTAYSCQRLVVHVLINYSVRSLILQGAKEKQPMLVACSGVSSNCQLLNTADPTLYTKKQFPTQFHALCHFNT